MLKRQFNPRVPHVAVKYLRMSDDLQNKRSPEQQSHEIDLTIQRMGYAFNVTKSYRDEAISGRLLRKRAGYQEMMRDIRSGVVQTDLILVDTIERFGRVHELESIRRGLYENHGVLVVAADSNFSDPLSPQGRALAMVENMRASEDGRIKAHNVLRGKRDCAILKHWPGGPAPFGYALKSVMKSVHGRDEVDHCILVPDPSTAAILQSVFAKAAATGWGVTRLARWLNEREDIQPALKPFSSATIGRQLDSTLYFGELTWNVHCTGIVADIRVLERNDETEWQRVPDFCQPLVTKELWMQVQALRELRRAKLAVTEDVELSAKQIQPSASGMTLNYLLSGLLYCSECGVRMVLSTTQIYVTKAGDNRNYASYRCPAYRAGGCANAVSVPEAWVREEVIAIIRQRLFPWAPSSKAT
ncbi:MAG: hypothetical protein C0485_17580 [Pirellula sp.]|nr:hypothetical protein [Pirellula sp.]